MWRTFTDLPPVFRLMAMLLVCSPCSSFASVDVLVISSNSGDVYQKVDENIQANFYPACAALNNGCPSVKWQSIDVNNEQRLTESLDNKPSLIVTLGGKAAFWALEHNPASPIVFTLIPKQTFNSMKQDIPDGMEYFVLFLDQPFDRQFKLIKYALPDRTRVGALLGPLSSKLGPELKRDADANNFSLNTVILDDKKNIGRSLKTLLDVSDVLFSVPDPLVFNRQSIFSILLTTYHSRTPVVGFSKAYVKAGALIALYSSPEQIGRHTAEIIADYYHGSSMPLPNHGYPRYFSVATNNNVARSLDISLPEPDELTKLLKRAPL